MTSSEWQPVRISPIANKELCPRSFPLADWPRSVGKVIRVRPLEQLRNLRTFGTEEKWYEIHPEDYSVLGIAVEFGGAGIACCEHQIQAD